MPRPSGSGDACAGAGERADPALGPACLQHVAAIWRRSRWLLAVGAIGIAGFHTVAYVALTQTTANNALLVLALAPAAILIGSALTGASRP